MVTVDFALPLDHPFLALAVLCHCPRWRIRRRRVSYDVLHQRCLPRSRGSLSSLLSWSSLLVLPPLQDVIRSLPAPRRFWAAPREQGFWEKDVCLLWWNMGKIYPDWEQNCYLRHFRMSKDMLYEACKNMVGRIIRTRRLIISIKNVKGFRNARKSIETSGDLSVLWLIAFFSGSEVLNLLQSGHECTLHTHTHTMPTSVECTHIQTPTYPAACSSCVYPTGSSFCDLRQKSSHHRQLSGNLRWMSSQGDHTGSRFV